MWPFTKKEVIRIEPIVDEPEVNEEAFAALCPQIKAILDAEIKAGNEMNGVSFYHWPKESCVLVAMKRIFVGKPGIAGHTVPSTVHFQHYDYHWIGDSYYCKEHNQIIIAAGPCLEHLK